ncbi:hypothetical protein C8R46DRAFT_1140952 [Mycena filopes]|nr:hypothetical protein C8R46DRAFT_1140952 [Mycena filopes]
MDSVQENKPATISDLPPEILADIFIRCVPVTIRKTHDVSFLNITQVSTLWRAVALACPAFWSTVILRRPEWIPTFLERSKMAALVIRADTRKLAHTGDLESLILENIPRLGILELRSSRWYLDDLWNLLESAGPATRLQCLTIANITPDDPDEGGMWLPSDLFQRSDVNESRRSHRIQRGLRLHLESCAFSWDSAWYSHLTHLHLANISLVQRPTMEMLLSILVGSPALEILTLIHCLPIQTTPHGFRVELPRLSAFTLKGDSPATFPHLMAYLMIPPSATVHVSCSMKTLEDVDVLLGLLADYAKVSPSTYDTVRILHQDGFKYVLLDSARPWWFRRFRIDGKSCQPYATLCPATTGLVERLDVANITTLHLHHFQGLQPSVFEHEVSMWAMLGEQLPHVRTLHLHQTIPAELFEFLLTQAMSFLSLTHFKYHRYGLARFGARTHAWARLQRLCLHDLDLAEDPEPAYPQRYMYALPVASRAEMLRALLWARREGGARILELQIEGCRNVFRGDLRHLRLFADVVYDGQGMVVVDGEEHFPCARTYSMDVLSRMVEQEERFRPLSSKTPLWSSTQT